MRWRTEEGGVSQLERRGCGGQISNGEKEAMGGGNHDLETRLSEMWGKLRKYPTDLRWFFRFRGTMSISRVGISQEVGVFVRVVISE